MFLWYKRAEICFAYLSDVRSPVESESSRWFTRGWTLQELIAPAPGRVPQLRLEMDGQSKDAGHHPIPQSSETATTSWMTIRTTRITQPFIPSLSTHTASRFGPLSDLLRIISTRKRP